jgi:heat shock protein beta
VFLREVISNAADALDKIRFVSISEPESLGETTELAIKVEFNSEEKSIAI